MAVYTIMCLEARAQRPESSGPVLSGNKSFTEIIPANANSQYGMLSVHEVGGKIYLEIPDSLLGRDILTINRIANGWAGDKPFDPFLSFLGFSGDLANESLFRFDRESDDAIVIYPLDYSNRIQAEDGKLALPTNADVLPILHSFPVLCRNRLDNGSLVDATDFLSGDNTIMTFSGSLRRKFKVGAMQSQHSAVSEVEVTDDHLITTSIKTYSYNSETVRFGMRSVWFLLPVIRYEIRQPDHRVGYYTQSATDYSNAYTPQQDLRMVKRWRMEPRPEDREAYFRGEPVEPAKPLVIYIDPAMPEEWVPYMIQGINDWQPALEQAGFKNAIRGERVPPGMESRMVGDARYPMVSYKPSRVRNATAELVTDPRSGEILNAHIAWHHGHIRNIIKWGRMMGAVHRPMLRGNETDTAFMGAMIRKIIAHEVGHVLGLVHNFGASSVVPVENLRDSDWLAKNPISPSIMDYVRVNYVAQPGDKVPLPGLIPRIGPYDRWAIEWGYRYRLSSGDTQADRQRLNNWTAETGDSGMRWFGAEERQSTDPRCQAEDLGDDPILAATYGINNLQRMVDSLTVWYPHPGQATEVYREVIGQYGNYLNSVTAWIGGRYHRIRTAEGEWNNVRVSTDDQTRALEFLRDRFITPPRWLLDNPATGRIGLDPMADITKLHERLMETLLVKAVADGSPDHPDRLCRWIFGQPIGNPEPDNRYRTSLRWTFAMQLKKIAFPENTKAGEAPTPQQLVARETISNLCTLLQREGDELLINQLQHQIF
ncbi:zinc-dependent metalloprotease [Parapedobacter soli]|uniref:zinc-dependent metalloprotease n=1 Tax=Parapedobacter soli TaxID=416955 RepID=UPI0021C79D56|nr:zinc-dependent metalloprotease [Parapedobacter soli]